MLAALGVAEDVCPYDGGWSLRVDSRYCPSSAPIDCGMGTQRRCCPSGYVCAGVGLQGGSWCCKEGEDCLNQARETPRVSTHLHAYPHRNPALFHVTYREG